MKKSKVFHIFYSVVLSGFIISSAVLAIRLMASCHENEFYEQIRATEDKPASVDLFPWTRPMAPENEEPKMMSVKPPAHFTRFAEEYPTTVAWLQIPGTLVDYPVMLGTDNQFYLRHLPNGSKSTMGSLFLDCRSDSDSLHWIVYGHNMADGKMFGTLKEYEDQDFFADHNSLTIITLDSVYVCPIFSVRQVYADSDAYLLDFTDNDSFDEYINRAASESLYPIEVDLEKAAKVVTLSTCMGRHNQRFIVQAILAQPYDF